MNPGKSGTRGKDLGNDLVDVDVGVGVTNNAGVTEDSTERFYR